MSKFTHFSGIDVSKDFFDAVILLNGDKDNPIHNQFENSYKGIKSGGLISFQNSFLL